VIGVFRRIWILSIRQQSVKKYSDSRWDRLRFKP